MPFEHEHQPPDLAALTAALRQLAPPFELPPGLGERVLAAVEAEAVRLNGAGRTEATSASEPLSAAEPRSAPAPVPAAAQPVGPPSGPQARRPTRPGFSQPRRFGLALAATAAVGIALLAGTRLDGTAGETEGKLEVEGTLEALQGEGQGDVVVALLGTGREVDFASDSLPILPTGEYYELWFVGPGDSPGDPNRISGGTFHPDEGGSTDVQLHAAVDPGKYPLIEITAEPGDGDPSSSGEVVLELDATELIEPE